MAGNRPRRLIHFRDWEIRLSRKSGNVGKFSEFYISKTGGDFVAKFLGFVGVRIAHMASLGDRYK